MQEAAENNQIILDLRQQLRDALAEVNAVKFSGRLGNSAKKRPQTSTATVEVPPVFDTSLTYQDAQGRKLFDNMKKEDSLRGTRHKDLSSSQGGGGGAGLSRSGKLLVQSLSSSHRSGGGSTENKTDNGSFMRSTLSSSGVAASPPPPPPSFGSTSQWLLTFRAELQRVVDADKVRVLSLHECRESILAAYESKAAADARTAARGTGPSASASSAPAYHADTMEMHVYRGLEKKYGLRSLAVDHAAMLLISVRLYADTDTDVELFYKIFRNDVEEEFRLVQNELKKSIKDLLMVQLMNKYAASYHDYMFH